MKSSIKNTLYGISAFLLSCVIINLTYSYYIKLASDDEKVRYEYVAKNQANLISSIVDKVVVRTYTVREMLYENKGNTAFFDNIIPYIYETVKKDTGVNLRNIAIAPGGKVLKVYPLKSNENLIGFNFTDSSLAGNKEANDAFMKGETIITNPFNLVQGGLGIAARTPVYILNGEEKVFWGLVTVIMDFENLLQAFNFIHFNQSHTKYCLWYENDSGEKVVLDSNADDFSNSISEVFKVYNLTWHIDLAPENGWYKTSRIMLGRILAFVVSMLLGLIVYFMSRIRSDGTKMKMLAEQDSLTHCYSRHYLNTMILNSSTGEWKNPKKKYSVAIIDVDKFKTINDTYGHNVGDKALTLIANVLLQNLFSKADRVVRFGGDEFVMILTELERKAIRVTFQNVLGAVENIRIEEFPDLKLTLSIGAVSYENAPDKSYKEMIKLADQKLYVAKENGRDNYEVI